MHANHSPAAWRCRWLAFPPREALRAGLAVFLVATEVAQGKTKYLPSGPESVISTIQKAWQSEMSFWTSRWPTTHKQQSQLQH
jgi:hypothetical protein